MKIFTYFFFLSALSTVYATDNNHTDQLNTGLVSTSASWVSPSIVPLIENTEDVAKSIFEFMDIKDIGRLDSAGRTLVSMRKIAPEDSGQHGINCYTMRPLWIMWWQKVS